MDDKESQLQAIRKRALALLARREHAPAELAQKLRRRDYDTADIAAVVDELAADDLLSAARYAESVVNARIARGQGPVRIRAELARAQIDESLIEQALENAAADWAALAGAARRKRFGREPPEDYETRTRQMRFLQQRGFDFDSIQAAVGGS